MGVGQNVPGMKYGTAHNTIIQASLEIGIFAAITLFVFIFYVVFMCIRTAWLNDRFRGEPFLSGLALGMLGTVILISFEPFYYNRFAWVHLALATSAIGVYRNRGIQKAAATGQSSTTAPA